VHRRQRLVASENDNGRLPPAVEMVALYGTPTIPPGSTVVVITNVFTAIVIVCVAVCGGVDESVTLAVNVNAPRPEAVPVSIAPLRAIPGGSVPLVIVAV